jgi:hypothetical protein
VDFTQGKNVFSFVDNTKLALLPKSSATVQGLDMYRIFENVEFTANGPLLLAKLTQSGMNSVCKIKRGFRSTKPI